MEPTIYELDYVRLYLKIIESIKNNETDNSQDDYELGVLDGRKQILQELSNDMGSMIANWNYAYFLGDNDERTT